MLPQCLYVIKYMFTTSVLLTRMVSGVLLTLTMSIAYLVSLSNILLHNLTPSLALLDFILFDREYGSACGAGFRSQT